MFGSESVSGKKSSAILAGLGVALLIAIGIWIGYLVSVGRDGQSGYTAVYLTTGDMYFGEFSRFPRPRLANAWYLERSVDASSQPQLGVRRFVGAFWSPAGDLYLNEKHIVWYAPVSPEGELVRFFADRSGASSLPGGSESGADGSWQVPAGSQAQ